MEETFKKCGSLYMKATVMLLVLLFKKHTFKTLFAMSLIANLVLAVSYMNAKTGSDFNNHKAYVLEQQVDSLKIMIGR